MLFGRKWQYAGGIGKTHALKQTGEKLYEDSKNHHFCTLAVGCFVAIFNRMLN